MCSTSWLSRVCCINEKKNASRSVAGNFLIHLFTFISCKNPVERRSLVEDCEYKSLQSKLFKAKQVSWSSKITIILPSSTTGIHLYSKGL